MPITTNNKMVTLINHLKVKPNKENEFMKWHESLSLTLSKTPGFISETITYPKPPLEPDWIILQHFQSRESAQSWLESDPCKELFKEASSFVDGLENVYLIEENNGFVTATISTIVDYNDENKFLNWNKKIEREESKFPGFIGHKLKRPIPGVNKAWTTIVTFDSNDNIDKWLKSNVRRKLIQELNEIKAKFELSKTYSGFNFWSEACKVNKNALWKENMIVLLMLYPIVFFLSYFQNFIQSKGVDFWIGLFISNAISTMILGFGLASWAMNKFSWWINPPKRLEKRYSVLGTILVIFLYIIILFVCWFFYKIAKNNYY